MSEPSLNFHIQTRLTQFKIPTELKKKNFKAIQKLVEKQKKQLDDDIKKVKKNRGMPAEMKLEVIRKNIKTFQVLKGKLLALIKKDEVYTSRILARLDNLKELAEYTLPSKVEQLDGTTAEEGGGEEKEISPVKIGEDEDRLLDLHNANLINWYRDQTNLLIIEYLIRTNTRSDKNMGLQLLKFISNTNPQFMKLIDYDLFDSFNRIFVSIVKEHDLTLVTGWLNENKSFLKKVNLNLEFDLNYCKFLSLIEIENVSEAIRFSRKNLSSYGNKNSYQDLEINNLESNVKKLKEIGGLLVYMSIHQNRTELDQNNVLFSSNLVSNTSRFKRYEKLLSNDRWRSLAECFIDNFTIVYGISKNHPLYIILSAGLSSLKTKSCYCNVENTIFKEDKSHMKVGDNDSKEKASLTDRKYRGPNKYYKILKKINHCPVCSPELHRLSENLPYAQLITSIFNNPFKLPNGNIYPFDKLLRPSEKYLLEKNTLLRMGKVKDPLTQEVFFIDDCIRVYPA